MERKVGGVLGFVGFVVLFSAPAPEDAGRADETVGRVQVAGVHLGRPPSPPPSAAGPPSGAALL